MPLTSHLAVTLLAKDTVLKGNGNLANSTCFCHKHSSENPPVIQKLGDKCKLALDYAPLGNKQMLFAICGI